MLAARLNALRTPNSIFISAGDLIGGSPLASGLFHDEGTVEAMNAMGLALNGVGNHEFDEGTAELRRMQSGGCHPVDGCQASQPFAGAKFRFLAANVFVKSTGQTVFPAYDMRVIGGVKIAFIGLTLLHTPEATLANGITDLEFRDEVSTVNGLVPELLAAGAKAIVVLIHQGSGQLGAPDQCIGLAGAIAPIANGFDSHVAVVMSAHTHAFYNCVLGGRIVTSAGSQGLAVTDVRLRFAADQTLTSAEAHNVMAAGDIPPDPAITALVNRYRALAAPIGNQVIGTIGGTLDRNPLPGGEIGIGDVIADAMLSAAMGAPANAGVALMNTGGVRATLAYAKSGSETVDGQVTYAEAFAVQPFANTLVTVSITGAQLRDILEASVSGANKHVEIGGLTFSWTFNADAGSKVDPADVLVGGVPLSLGATYRVVTNAILADALSGYASLASGGNRVGGGIDLDALKAYFSGHSPVSVPSQRVFVK